MSDISDVIKVGDTLQEISEPHRVFLVKTITNHGVWGKDIASSASMYLNISNFRKITSVQEKFNVYNEIKCECGASKVYGEPYATEANLHSAQMPCPLYQVLKEKQ